VLAYTLDVLLRLLHPLIPFLTEEVWQLLAEVTPERGIDRVERAAESIMIAPWPESETSRRDLRIEARFARFQEVLRAVREVRSRQNVPPKKQIEFSVRCDEEVAELLKPMEQYFRSMAGARPADWGADVEPPPLSANATSSGIEVFVDLADLIDVDAEIARKEKELARLESLIAAKKKKLGNANFIQRAPEAVVRRERDSLKEIEQQRLSTSQVLANFQSVSSDPPCDRS
jgi:valyl-tRNA synthetase